MNPRYTNDKRSRASFSLHLFIPSPFGLRCRVTSSLLNFSSCSVSVRLPEKTQSRELTRRARGEKTNAARGRCRHRTASDCRSVLISCPSSGCSVKTANQTENCPFVQNDNGRICIQFFTYTMHHLHSSFDYSVM